MHQLAISNKEQEDSFAPPIEITSVMIAPRLAEVHIVREDLLPGGTKQRAIVPLLSSLAEQGFSEFVYASPFCGFAQVALAYAGKILGLKVTLFCETINSPERAGRKFHSLSRLAESFGATIIGCESLSAAETQAELYASERLPTFKIPLGFNHPQFLKNFSQALREQVEVLESKLGFMPSTLWLPVGSGTLAKVFRSVLPSETNLKCVDVRVLLHSDERIKNVYDQLNTKVFRSDIPFHEKSHSTPPVPSNQYYDAKLWSYLEKFASDQDVWWNVAR